MLPKEDTINKLKEFINEYTYIFDLDNIIKYHLDKIDNSFNLGYCENIDNLQKDIDNCNIILRNLAEKLSNYRKR